MSAFQYDESDWPIVRIVSPDALIDDASFERHLERLTFYLRRRSPLVFIIQFGSSTSLSVQQRDRIRRHELEQRALIGQFQRGLAVVVQSPFQRALIGAVFWLVRSPSPTQAFADIDGAVAWARGLLGPRATASHVVAPRPVRA